MEKIGVFYSSSRGKSEFTAQLVKEFYSEKCEIYTILNNVDRVKEFKKLIFIIPTYGCGVSHEDWNKNLEELSKIDFKDREVGLIGRGNQGFFAATFIDGIRPIYDIVIKNNGIIKGFTETTDYSFVKSRAVIEDKFIGLALDEMFMLKETKEKLEEWLKFNFGDKDGK
ncbi:flavodoxin [uncultured Cetobacterium sp.]|uniref:flavodoxin n=1 Tax=uncultured Cetobacterium sp. TaxID=527638 RepID=UPI0026211A9C|nr:flavodoxin [uncultured Cetobacterium sp.]